MLRTLSNCHPHCTVKTSPLCTRLKHSFTIQIDFDSTIPMISQQLPDGQVRGMVKKQCHSDVVAIYDMLPCCTFSRCFVLYTMTCRTSLVPSFGTPRPQKVHFLGPTLVHHLLSPERPRASAMVQDLPIEFVAVRAYSRSIERKRCAP